MLFYFYGTSHKINIITKFLIKLKITCSLLTFSKMVNRSVLQTNMLYHIYVDQINEIYHVLKLIKYTSYLTVTDSSKIFLNKCLAFDNVGNILWLNNCLKSLIH